MRDINDKNIHNDDSNKTVFNKFKSDVKALFDEKGIELKYVLSNYIVIYYKSGFLEVYDYDRPRNPRFEDGFFKFDYSFLGKTRTIKLELV